MKTMMVGDTHGNSHWLQTYIFPVAMSVGAQRIVVLGDFGAWEHTSAGVQFMDECDALGAASGIPLYWLHGNHDKWSHTVDTYRRNVDSSGFLACRDTVYYIPQGLAWTWSGVWFRSFGGAYSIDKSWRRQREDENYRRALAATRRKVGAGELFGAETVASTVGTLWFPEEEMTDIEMDRLLTEDTQPKDIIVSHDKPLSSQPGWDRKSFPACIPNQLRLDRAMKAHKPSWWLHGHLHYHYVDKVRGGDWETTVIGLDPDHDAGEQTWQRNHTWALVQTGMEGITVSVGDQVRVEPASLLEHRMKLHIALDR